MIYFKKISNRESRHDLVVVAKHQTGELANEKADVSEVCRRSSLILTRIEGSDDPRVDSHVFFNISDVIV